MKNQQEKEFLNEVKHSSGKKLAFYAVLIFLCFGIFGIIIPALLVSVITDKSVFSSYSMIVKIFLVAGYSLIAFIPISYFLGRNNKNFWKKELRKNIDSNDRMINWYESRKQENSEFYESKIDEMREKIESYKKDSSLNRKEIISKYVDLLKKKDSDLEEFYQKIDSVPDTFIKITIKQGIEDMYQKFEDEGLDEISRIHKDDDRSLKEWDELFEKISLDYKQAIIQDAERFDSLIYQETKEREVFENLFKQIERGQL